MIGLTPFASIGQSVLGPYVFQQFGHLTAIESLLSSALLWVGAVSGAGSAGGQGMSWAASRAEVAFLSNSSATAREGADGQRPPEHQ